MRGVLNMKNVEELVKSLYQNDLNKFAFGVYRLENGNFELSLKGSSPEFYEDFLGIIGGDYETKYTKKEIQNQIEEMLG